MTLTTFAILTTLVAAYIAAGHITWTRIVMRPWTWQDLMDADPDSEFWDNAAFVGQLEHQRGNEPLRHYGLKALYIAIWPALLAIGYIQARLQTALGA